MTGTDCVWSKFCRKIRTSFFKLKRGQRQYVTIMKVNCAELLKGTMKLDRIRESNVLHMFFWPGSLCGKVIAGRIFLCLNNCLPQCFLFKDFLASLRGWRTTLQAIAPARAARSDEYFCLLWSWRCCTAWWRDWFWQAYVKMLRPSDVGAPETWATNNRHVATWMPKGFQSSRMLSGTHGTANRLDVPKLF